MDLYKLLNLEKSASAEVITKAYRKFAQKHHPDKGGDRELFESIHLAYEVLSDPARRAKYDATGEFGKLVADNPTAALMETLLNLVAEETCKLLEAGLKIDEQDLVDRIRSRVAEQHKSHKENLKKLEDIRDGFDEAVKRFNYSGEGVNILEQAARHHLAEATKGVASMKIATDRLGKTLEYLANCKYIHIARPQQGKWNGAINGVNIGFVNWSTPD